MRFASAIGGLAVVVASCSTAAVARGAPPSTMPAAAPPGTREASIPTPAALPPASPIPGADAAPGPTAPSNVAPLPAGAGPTPFTLLEEDTWLDAGHALLGERVLGTIFALDRFFSDERDLEPERNRSFLRWRNDLRLAQYAGPPRYRTGLRADLRFPGVSRWLDRLKLVFTGETSDPLSTVFPDARPADRARGADAELRYALLDTLRTHLDVGAGALFSWPPGGFGRLRFRAARPIGELGLVRFAEIGFWRSDVGFGETTELALERALLAGAALRLGGGATLSDRSHGLEWGSELSVIRQFGRAAIVVGSGAWGATRPISEIDGWRVYTRFRQDFFRRWLFFELEPEVAWPLDRDVGSRPRTFAATFRMEVQFQAPRTLAPTSGSPRLPAPGPAPAPIPADQAPSPRPSSPLRGGEGDPGTTAVANGTSTSTPILVPTAADPRAPSPRPSSLPPGREADGVTPSPSTSPTSVPTSTPTSTPAGPNDSMPPAAPAAIPQKT